MKIWIRLLLVITLLSVQLSEANTFKSTRISIVDIKTFGAVGDGKHDDTNAINKAIAYIEEIGGTLYFPSGTYLTNGAHILNVKKSITIKGSGVTSTKIIHKGDNILFYFKSDPPEIWSSSGIQDINIIGPTTGAKSICMRFSDSWGFFAKSIFISNYNSSTAIEFYNDMKWTEGYVLEDIMIRDAMVGIKYTRSLKSKVYRSSLNGKIISDPGSSFGFGSIQRVSMGLSAGNGGNTFILNDFQEDLPKLVYNQNWNGIRYWMDGSGGNKIAVACNGKGNEISGTINIVSDGVPIPDGSDCVMFQAWNGGIIDMSGYANPAAGSSRLENVSFQSIIKQLNYQETNNLLQPTCRVKGAILNLKGIAKTGKIHTFKTGLLPPLGQFKLSIKFIVNNDIQISHYLLNIGSGKLKSSINLFNQNIENKWLSVKTENTNSQVIVITLDATKSQAPIPWEADLEMM